MHNKIHFEPFVFKNFIWTTEAGKLAWSATLRRHGRRVGSVYAKGGRAALRILFESDGERVLLEHHVAQIPDACISTSLPLARRVDEFLLALADQSYHARRLQVMSLRHTVFQLTDDDERNYRYLPNLPPGAAVIGRLRLIYGERLARVLREEDVDKTEAADASQAPTARSSRARRAATGTSASPSLAVARG